MDSEGLVYIKYREPRYGGKRLDDFVIETFGFIKSETDFSYLLEHRRVGKGEKYGDGFVDNSGRYETILKSSIVEIVNLYETPPPKRKTSAKKKAKK